MEYPLFSYVFLLLVPAFHAITVCSDIVWTEMGTNKSISFETDPRFIDFYWYNGSASLNDLVCKLDNGRKTVSEKYRGYYDISDSGALIILHATLRHELLYTVVTFDLNGISEEASVKVNITVSPDPACPGITGCSPCAECIIDQPRKSDTLTCSIRGARPLIPLTWSITSKSGISFVIREAYEERIAGTSSWNTYLSLNYEVERPCGVHAKVQCKAEDVANVTTLNIASLEITNDPCSDDIPATDAGPSGFPLIAVIIVIVILGVIIAVCVLALYFKRCRRRTFSQEEGMRSGAAENLLPRSSRKGQIKRETLVNALADFYEKFCYVKPLPWGEPIPIAALYTGFQCLVTPVQSSGSALEESQDLAKISSSDDLFVSSSFKNASRVIFIADLGYGKTTMTQQVVQRWIKEDKKNFILVYIQLKDVNINQNISALVKNRIKNMLPSSICATEEDIAKVLKENKTLVVMDGLDELSMSQEKQEKNESDKDKDFVDFDVVPLHNGQETAHAESVRDNKTGNRESVCDNMTIGNLLKGKAGSLTSQMRIWVTSREVDDMKSPFPPPHVKIKMSGFLIDQVDACIRKICEYYCQSVNVRKSEATKMFVEEVIKQVRENLEKDDIIQEFSKTPLLLFLIINVLSANHSGALSHLKDLNLTKLTTLIRTLITCLESKYVQKTHDVFISSKIETIERKLGEIAWKKRLQVKNYDRDGWDKLLGTENVEIALSIGLLRLSKNISDSNSQMRQLAFTSFTGVEFYHQYFQEYLAGHYFSAEGEAMKGLHNLFRKVADVKPIRFLQFMAGSGNSSVGKVSQRFLEDEGMWNNFIDFIYETEDQEKVKSYLEALRYRGGGIVAAPAVNFKYMDKKYHQDAVTSLCANCNLFDIKMRSFMFGKDCPLKYLTGLVLPQLQRLDFFEMDISEEEFVSILKWIAKQKLPKILQFTKCKFKEELTSESKEEIKVAMEGKELNIYWKETTCQTKVTINEFNVEKGKWKIGLLPKHQ